MKIITKCIIDIESLLVIKEESFEYNGQVALCKGGSGGGGGAGVVDYPSYMKTWHGDALNSSGADTLSSSVTDIMNAAIGNSPFAAEVAYDPDAELVTMLSAPDDLSDQVAMLSSGTGLDEIVTGILDDSRIDDAVTEFSTDLGNRLTVEVIPRFEAGMRDINAVMSSAFVIGRAILEDEQTRQVAKYSADLHMKAFGDDAIRIIQLKLQYQHLVSSLIVETNRMKIVAKKEEADTNTKIAESDALWDLEVFKYGGNLLSSIGGSAVGAQKHDDKGSALGGALSGAMGGAVAGSQIYPGWGTVIGAVLGAAAGYYSS